MVNRNYWKIEENVSNQQKFINGSYENVKSLYRVAQKMHTLQTKNPLDPQGKISKNMGTKQNFSFSVCTFFGPLCVFMHV
jgi:hypothetical protein